MTVIVELVQNHEMSSTTALENIAPALSTIDHWVLKQTKQDHSLDATTTRRDQTVTPPRRFTSVDQYACQAYPLAHTGKRQPPTRVYSIETLLKLRKTQSKVPVMLRVKPEAIAGEIGKSSRDLSLVTHDGLTEDVCREYISIFGRKQDTSNAYTSSWVVGNVKHLPRKL